jgi:hypothetical protein
MARGGFWLVKEAIADEKVSKLNGECNKRELD